ncbi:MAG: hypothetical protein J0H54_05280 [Rhizobiales bacterium]|nr:hypothetical protein [Hyphomicrobiales bacterium]
MRLYREGKGDIIARSPAKAKAVLDQYQNILSPRDLAYERLLLDGTRATRASDYARIAAAYRELPADQRAQFLVSLRRPMPNLYVAILQNELKSSGIYAGPVSGLLTQPTLAAIAKFCKQNDVAAACQGGPLSQPAAQAISRYL